jgi:hypothetical protein
MRAVPSESRDPFHAFSFMADVAWDVRVSSVITSMTWRR